MTVLRLNQSLSVTAEREIGSTLIMFAKRRRRSLLLTSFPLSAIILSACQPHAAVEPVSQAEAPSPAAVGRSPLHSCQGGQYCTEFQTQDNPSFEIFLSSQQSEAELLPAPAGGPSAQALRLQAAGQQAARVQIDLKSQGLMGEQLFGRSWLFLESTPTTAVHWNLLSVGGTREDGLRASYAYGGQHPIASKANGSQLMAHYETPDFYQGKGEGSDCWQHSEQEVMPTGRWVCVEWAFSQPDNSMALWLDGQSIPSLSVQDSGQGCVHQREDYLWQAPAFEEFWLGWQSYQPDSQRTLWLADLRLSSRERIGCD